MKIIQLIMANQLRGVEIFTAQVSNRMLEQGHQVRVVALTQGIAKLPFAGSISVLGNKRMIRFFDWDRMKSLAKLVQNEKPDIVQANAGDTLRIAVFSKLIFRWKSPIIFRNASTVSLYIKNKVVRRFYNFLYGQVEYVISVSEYSMRDFIKTFPGMHNRIKTIPIGIDSEMVVQKSRPSDYLVHVGGFTFEKNHDGLLRIFKKLIEEGTDLELWLIGDGPLRSNAEQYVLALGIQHKVKFLGHQPHVLQYIASARALLLPSIIEGLPGVILEAMMVRTPVVSYATGGIPEIVLPEKTGWLVEKGNELAFVAAVGNLLTDKNKVRVLTENAHKLIMENYSNQDITEKFLSLYQNISRKHGASKN